MRVVRYYGTKECDNCTQHAIWEIPSWLGPEYLCQDCKEKLSEGKVSTSE